MKSTAKREIALAGIILGAAIAGPAAGAALTTQASRVVRLPTDGSKYARRWAT